MFSHPNAESAAAETEKAAVLDTASAPPLIANASLLFQGEYTRQGPDLLITHPDHGSLTIIGYFIHSPPASLTTPEGAFLDGQTVAQLAGPQASTQFAQAGGAAASAPIGSVQTVSGTVTAQRTDGTNVVLAAGDPVFQGDVVQTSAAGSLVIIFADETLFTLSADARMVLDELIYSPGGSGNSMVINLVQGSFVFVTGQVAPTGDMRVETPTATMGIRGTTPVVQISALDGATRFALAVDPDGQLGSYQLFDRVSGQLLGTVDTTDSTFLVQSAGALPVITARTPAEFAATEGQIQLAYSAYGSAGLGQQSPGGPQNGGQNDGQNGGQQNGNSPDQTDAGPGQIQGGPVPDLSGPDLSPLGGGASDGPAGTDTSGDRSGRSPFAPDTAPLPSAPPPGGTSAPEPAGDSSLPPSGEETLAVVVPDALATREDVSFSLNGLTVEIPGNGDGTVSITARSTVTLAQITGLTFLAGDGVADETVTFSGTESAINAALDGMVYTPAPDSEMGGLSVTVFDGTTSLSAEVPIAIEPVFDAPIVYDIALTVSADGSVTAPFLGADPDIGDILTLEALSAPAAGRLDVFDDGTFTFSTDGAFGSLSAGSVRDITFQYTATDSTGLVSEVPATVTITVTGLNDPPRLTVTPPPAFTEAADASAQVLTGSGFVIFNDIDQDDTLTLSFEMSGAPVWSGGDLDAQSPDLASILSLGFAISGVDPDTGLYTTSARQGVLQWSYSAEADLDFLEAGDTISFSYDVTVQDAAGDSIVKSVSFVITGTEDAPDLSGGADGSSPPLPQPALYEAGGETILDFSGWDEPVLVNLDLGTFQQPDGPAEPIGTVPGTRISRVLGGSGDDVLTGSHLDDTLHGGPGLDTLTGGAGADTFGLAGTDIADVIVDFEAGEDRLDLSALLDAHFSTADLSAYVRVTQDGSNAIVSVDRDGAATASDFKDVAVLQSIDAGGIIDFVFSDNGVQTPDTVVS